MMLIISSDLLGWDIGTLFGVGCSSIIRRVALIKSRLDKDWEIKKYTKELSH